MEIIEELERTRRGIYAGGVLYLDFAGNLDSCIALRTMVIKNGVAHVQAGGGLVADSTPLGEYQETLNKSRALLAALEAAHQSKYGMTQGRRMPAAHLSKRKSSRNIRSKH
jgi:anthranilate synthase component 1